MRLRINQLPVRLAYGEGDVIKAVCRKLICQKEQLHDLEILRRSLDARKRDREPSYILSVEVDHSGKPPKLTPGQIEKAPNPEPPLVFPNTGSSEHPPVVIGAGPAGLMAALTLAEAGRKPLLIERGAETPDREEQVKAYWKNGTLDPESNVLYGEGGAGLGLYLLFDCLHTMCLNLVPGRCTEVLGLVDIRGSFRNLVFTPRSFNYFVHQSHGSSR